LAVSAAAAAAAAAVVAVAVAIAAHRFLFNNTTIAVTAMPVTHLAKGIAQVHPGLTVFKRCVEEASPSICVCMHIYVCVCV